MVNRSRALIILYWVVLLSMVPAILQLKINPDATETFLSKTDHRGTVYEEFKRNFPVDYGASVIVTMPVPTPNQWWLNLVELSHHLEGLPEVERVYSLAEVGYIENVLDDSGSPETSLDDFLNEPTLAALRSDDKSVGETLRKKAEAYKPYANSIISQNSSGQKAVILFAIAADKGAINAVEFTRGITEELEPFKEKATQSGYEIFQMGELAVSKEISIILERSAVVIGITALLIVLAMTLISKSLVVGLLTAWTGFSAVLMTWGVMGYCGVQRDPVVDLVVQLFIPLGTANAIHAYSLVKRNRNASYDFLSVFSRESFGFATLTTLAGFAFVAVTTVPAMQLFGIFGMVGIVATLFTMVTFVLPVMIKLASIKTPWVGIPAGTRALRQWQPILLSRRSTVLLVLAMAVFGGIGVYTAITQRNYNPVTYLRKSNEVRQEFELARQWFAPYTAVIMFRGSPPDQISGEEWGEVITPEMQLASKDLADLLKAEFPGLQVSMIYDQLAELSEKVSNGKQVFPETKDAVSQFLLAFWGDDKYWVPALNADGTKMAMLVQTPFTGSVDYRHLVALVEKFKSERGLDLDLTGRVHGYWTIGDQVVINNLLSLGASCILVFVCFALLFRSVKLGLLGLLPNVLPVLGSLAIMGLFRIPLDLGTSIVSAIVLVLVDDDTGHFIAHYNHKRKSGLDAPTAAKQAFAELFGPVCMVTMVISFSFVPMYFAPLTPFATFAGMLSATMIYALVVESLLLPNLLAHFDRRKIRSSEIDLVDKMSAVAK